MDEHSCHMWYIWMLIHTTDLEQFYNNTANYGRPLILLKTHVVLVRVACGSNIPQTYDVV